MTVSLLLIVKLTVTPLLVAGMSLAAKRFGPTFGGLIMGLPWMTGPILYFLTIDKGVGFASAASIGILLAVAAIASYLVVYAWCARVFPWWISLIAASSAFVMTGFGLRHASVGVGLASAIGAGSLLAGLAIMPRPRTGDGPRGLPWWDIPMRMLATAGMVAIITILADRIGPRLSGVVASFPVITTVIGSFSHARWGSDAVIRLIRAMSLSLMAFIAFFAVVALAVTRLSLPVTFALACFAGLSISAGLISFARWKASRVTVASGRPVAGKRT